MHAIELKKQANQLMKQALEDLKAGRFKVKNKPKGLSRAVSLAGYGEKPLCIRYAKTRPMDTILCMGCALCDPNSDCFWSNTVYLTG